MCVQVAPRIQHVRQVLDVVVLWLRLQCDVDASAKRWAEDPGQDRHDWDSDAAVTVEALVAVEREVAVHRVGDVLSRKLDDVVVRYHLQGRSSLDHAPRHRRLYLEDAAIAGRDATPVPALLYLLNRLRRLCDAAGHDHVPPHGCEDLAQDRVPDRDQHAVRAFPITLWRIRAWRQLLITITCP